MPSANLLILVAVFLPPAALDILGRVVEERTVRTPYGDVGPLALRVPRQGRAVWVQPYTGSPVRTDPRATIYAAAELQVQRILNWDTAAALNPILSRGQLAIVVDYIDHTRRQPDTFGSLAPAPGGDIVPFEDRSALCPHLNDALHRALPFAVEVVYLGIDGPRRETPAEARLFRSWGADVLGRNLLPEAALAHEVGLCYAGLVSIADYGADRPPPGAHGEMRTGLGLGAEALPAFVDFATQPATCPCNRSTR